MVEATVLFADVVGSTALGDALDPEEVQEVVGTAVSQIVQLVGEHGGTVAEIAGDGVLAVFGRDRPVHHDVDRAVTAGACIAGMAREHARDLEQDRGLTGFGVRVGLHTGDVIITPSTDGEHLSGDGVETAMALEAAAAPCTLLVSERTVQRLSSPRPWTSRCTVSTPHGDVEARTFVPTVGERRRGTTRPTPSVVPPPPGQGMREERKVVTAVFVRVHVHPETDDASGVRASAIERAVEVIERYGGSVKDRASGGLACIFGVPRAREDDAERAVRAALEAVAGVASDQAAASVGVTTGVVVVGPMGAESHLEYSATGDTMNTAARLHVAARPGTVLVGPRTHRLVEHRFVWSTPRVLTLKGKSRPVVAHTPRGPARGAPTRLVRGPLVGREAERRQLEQVLDAGRGFVVLEAEAGLGKSRLLDELHELQSCGSWLESRCLSFEVDRPYGPLRSLALAGLGVGVDADEAVVRRALDDLTVPSTTSAFLALVAGVPTSTDEQRALGAVAGPTVRHRVAEALASQWHNLPQPVIVAIEDAHWAPPATVGALSALVGLLDEVAVILVVTRRPDPEHASQALADQAIASGHHVRLGPLTVEDQYALLTEAVGVGVLPLEVEQRVVNVASGNPFFAEELLASLRDQGCLVPVPGGWSFVGHADVDLPDTVERVLLARLDQLPPLPRTILDAASIVGRDFSPNVVAAVAGVSEDLDPALATLVDARLVTPLPDGGLTFRHSLVHETAYNRVLRRHRRALHRRAAAALTERGLDDGAVARHWWQGGDAAAALACARRAGKDALDQGDPERAVGHLALAVEAADAVRAPAAEQLETLAALGEAARVTGRLTEATRWLERAGDLASTLGDTETLARVAVAFEDTTFASRRARTGPEDVSNRLLAAAMELLPPEHPLSIPVAARRAQALLFAGQERHGRELADTVVERARTEGSAASLAQALLAWRMGRQGPDGLEERLSTIDETVAAADRAGSPQLALEASRLRVMDLLEHGDVAAADDAIADATARIETLREPQYLWYPAMWSAMRLLLAADLDRAEAAVARFHSVGRRYRFGGATAVHGLQSYLLRREQGRAAEAQDLVLRLRTELGPVWWPAAAALAADVGDVDDATHLVEVLTGPQAHDLPRDLSYGGRLALVAEAIAMVGDRRAARYVYTELLPFRERVILVGSGAACLGAASHHLGLLARTLGRHAAAREHLEDAVTRNMAMGATAAVGHSRCELASLPTVDPVEARQLLRVTADVAARRGLVRLRDRAAELLQERTTEEDSHAGAH